MKRNQKGFTLAELLIVVAIIAVLVAISIPIFTTQLEKARESTDAANLRAAYAQAAIDVLESEKGVTSAPVVITQTTAGWVNANLSAIGDVKPNDNDVLKAVKSGDKVTVTVGTDGSIIFAKVTT